MKLFTSIKNITQKFVSKKLIVAGAIALGLGASYGVVQAEFYPDRQPFDYNVTCDPSDSNVYDRCGSLDGPVFNSFINTPSYGDERAFADARRTDQTAAGSYKNVLSDVTEGSQEVIIRTYVHNNANTSTNASGLGIAKDTTVRIDLPEATSNVLRARSYIDASNASLVEDTVDFTAAGDFRVEYIPGSAMLYNNGVFADGVALSDNIVTTGALIGYDALNGELPGCFDYEAIVHVRVKIVPVEQPEAELEKQVRIKGTTEWKQEVTANPGDTVQWLLTTQVTGDQQLDNIVIRDVPAPNTTLVPGTVRVIDASRNDIVADGPLFDGGFNFGNYAAGSGFYTAYESTIEGDFEGCDARVRNQAFVKSDQNSTELRDTADVVIVKENCEETNPVVVCNALTAGTLSLNTGESTVFTASAAATDATITGYKFSVNGEVVQNSASNTYTFTRNTAGQYIVSVVVVSSIGEIAAADCAKTVTVENEVVAVCDALTAPKLGLNIGESTVFTADASAEGTTVESYEFTVNGEVVQNTASNTFTYNATNAGSYDVAVTVVFANGDRETNENCAKTVTVAEENDPIYACEHFTFKRNDRTVTVSFVPRAENGATFKDATIVYTADGSEKNEELTNKISSDNKVVSTYTYDDKAVNVYAKATVRFNITNQDGSREMKEVVCQGKAVLSSTTPETPTELPSTGAGSTMLVLVAAVAGAGSFAHRKRTLARQ